MASRRPKKRKVYSKTKASKETTARRGMLTLLTVALLFAGLAGLWIGLSYIGSLFFSRNPHFELNHIVMRSDGRLSSSQLIEYAELQTGVNLFAVDFDTLRENLEKVSMVESVRIRRKLPDTLLVDVKERVAVAQVHWKW
ncbi:MAG TPA: FtsQ-type POTRA domain-containing protein, partial [Tichowtungia sp.]|nr:FtsQ-type POTRA domain-containing protein [Tichowtungia sp.]